MGQLPYPEDEETIGQWIDRMLRQLLQQQAPDGKRWTVERFARALGMRNDSLIYRWKTGKVEPGAEYVRQMSAIFGEHPPGLSPRPTEDEIGSRLARIEATLERIEQAVGAAPLLAQAAEAEEVASDAVRRADEAGAPEPRKRGRRPRQADG